MLSKILLGIGIFCAVFAVLVFSGKLPGVGSNSSSPTGEVVIWGTFPEASMNPIIQSFNPQAKTFRVSYVEVSENNFNQHLLEALANGKGPDLILAPYQNILAQRSRLLFHPPTSVNEQTYKNVYIDGAADLFWTTNGAFAFPVSVEPMVLFFNRTMLSKHSIANPPFTWNELEKDSLLITSQNSKGQFVESGIALGSPSVPHNKDIIMLIVEQLNQTPVLRQYGADGEFMATVTANTPTAEREDIYPLSTVLTFISKFADPKQRTYSWNQYLGAADEQFVAEKLAMYIGYSGEFSGLKARNPRARFDVAFMPQVNGYNTKATGMKMYGLAVLATSKNPGTALATQKYFAGEGVINSIATAGGGIPPTKAFASSYMSSNPVFASSMLVAHGWYDVFADESTSYVSSMLSDVINNRATITDAANTFVSRMQDLYTPLK